MNSGIYKITNLVNEKRYIGNKSISEKYNVTIKTIEGIKYGGKWKWTLEGLES